MIKESDMEELLSRLITAPWSTMVIFTAVRLNLFTILKDKYMTVNEIAVETNTHPHILEAVLRASESLGLLNGEQGSYGNTAFSLKYLVEGEPNYVGDLIKLQFQEVKNWGKLDDIVRKQKGKDVSEEAVHRTFIKAMNNIGQLGEAEALVDAVDLAGCEHLADFGGGSGLFSISLCKRYAQLQVTLIDKKETLKVTREYLEQTLVRSRVALQEGDIVKDVMKGNYDAVLLSDVIYDARIAKGVLDNVIRCLKPGGQLIIRGYYSDPGGQDSLFSRLFVLQEFVFDPDREVLNMSSLSELIKNRGFDIVYQGQLTKRSQILLAKK
jgi:SAM-dependent methyltransferase